MTPTWTIIGKSKTLKAGDVGAINGDTYRVTYIDHETNVYAEKIASIAKVEKKAAPVEKKIGDGLFNDLINRIGPMKGVERPVSVTKDIDGATFEFVPGIGLVRKDPDAPGLTSPKPTDGKRDPQNPASSFPRSSSIVDRPVQPSDASVRPMGPYAMVEGSEVDLTSGGTLPADSFLGVRTTAPIGEPGMYSPSQPKDRTAIDDVVPPDFDSDDHVDPWDLTDSDREGEQKSTKSIRLGTGYIFKRQYKDRA